MIFDIVKGQNLSIGPIKMGMSRKAVRIVLGNQCRPFKRTEETEIPSDYYEDDGIFVYYKKPAVVVAVEVARPVLVTYDGLRLLEESYQKLTRSLEAQDPALIKEADGLISKKLGIAIYAPNATDDADQLADSVTVFEKGYYD